VGNYVPTPPPGDAKALVEYVHRELRRVGDVLADPADAIHYMTPYADASLSDGISANWKCPNATVIRCSTSATITITGIAYKQAKRNFTFLNVGTGVLTFKNAGTESSASFRFALPSALYQISANHAVMFWYDPASARHRPISRT
jgi:5-keto 4-deoxyuronate isomerase